MIALNKTSLKNKLFFIITLSNSIILCVVVGLFSIYSYSTLEWHRHLQQELLLLTNILTTNSRSQLQGQPLVPLVDYHSQSIQTDFNLNLSPTQCQQLINTYNKYDNHIAIPQHPFFFGVQGDVCDTNKLINHIIMRMQMDLHPPYFASYGLALTIIVSVLLVLGLMWLLTTTLQRMVIQPLEQVRAVLKHITHTEDYSPRVAINNNQALDGFINCFNAMLDKVEARDTVLGQYQEKLEDMVMQRTAELVDSHNKAWLTAHELGERTRELASARDQAEAANRAKSVFLANMSHELRTPLNSILGYAQILLRDKKLDERQHNGVQVIQRSGGYLLTLISDILDLSKIETGKIELHPHDFVLQDFVNSIVDLFHLRAEQKGITFSCQMPPDPLFDTTSQTVLPQALHADEKRLRQILINLLSNAIKFTPKGEIHLKIGQDSHGLRFQVEDTGIGIAATDLERILQPFQQAGDVLHKAEGTGLGLSITKKLVELMGGQLQVESHLGQGSTFWFSLDLPVAQHLAKSEPLESMDNIIGYRSTHNNEPLHLLVVDDQVENRMLLTNWLTPLGFSVDQAENSEMALQRAAYNPPDLIFMDLIIPNMNGFEAVRRLRQCSQFVHTPIIVVSTSVLSHYREQCKAAGCNDFLTKPVQATQLFQCLQKHLNLTWIYTERTESPPPSNIPNHTSDTSQDTILNSQQAEGLYDLAMRGNIAGIVKYIDKLSTQQPTLTPFCNKIRTLANQFEEEAICELVEHYLE